ncbi:MAG: hypothetical protein M3R24_04605 [Chloroflexota bacterium]|nr:hypothetical protein [Chloroflexota bacterium]
MWDLDPTDRLVRHVMSVAVLVTLLLLWFMSLQVHPQRLSPVFASATSTPTALSQP